VNNPGKTESPDSKGETYQKPVRHCLKPAEAPPETNPFFLHTTLQLFQFDRCSLLCPACSMQ
ncbi:hypothetical protein NK034_23205, partial [Klebsiella pneumoniae]|nr:hypothetical protein [Klebsiella pneumoniae]